MRKNFFRTTFMGLMITFGTNAETATTNAPASQISSPGAPVIQIPTTNYVQEYLRTYTENPDLELNNVGANKIASEKYILSAIDLINGDTDYAADGRPGSVATMSYLESAAERIELCHVPWDTEITMYIRAGSYFRGNGVASVPVVADWQSVAWGNDMFVAVAYGNVAVYSPDGITWEQTTLPEHDNWDTVTYGDGKFVAIAYASDNAAYSDDGINWFPSKMPSSKLWTAMAYGDGKFVAIAYDSDNAAYSDDGINWLSSKMPVSSAWVAIAYGNGTFVAITQGAYRAYSTDAINWVLSDTLSVAHTTWHTVVFGNDMFLTGGTYTEYKRDDFGRYYPYIWGESTAISTNNGKTWVLKMSATPLTGYMCTNAIYFDNKFLCEIGAGDLVTMEDGYPMHNYTPSISSSYDTPINARAHNGKQIISVGNGIYYTTPWQQWHVGTGRFSYDNYQSESPIIGGLGGCEGAICSCVRTHLIDKSGTFVENAATNPVTINRTFESNDACNLQCAEICADNAVNNTDGAQKAILCGK